MSASQEIQANVNTLERRVQTGLHDDGTPADEQQVSIWYNDLASKRDELTHALAEEAQQQNLQERVEQAKENGYILDKIEINGQPAIAYSHTPENHELLAIAVQKEFLSQEDVFNRKYEEIQELGYKSIKLCAEKDDEIDKLEAKNRQLIIEKLDAESKRDNAINRMEEMANELKDLKEQLTGEAIPLAPLSAEERDIKLVADLMGSRLKVTNIRFADESGLDRRKVLANNALTGELIEEYAIYSKTRWDEIKEEAAEQLRIEYANKKAENDALNEVIPVNTPEPIPVLEEEAPATEETFQTDQVETDSNGADQTSEGNRDLEQVVAEESEVTRKGSEEFVTFKDLADIIAPAYNRIRNLEKQLSEQAVA